MNTETKVEAKPSDKPSTKQKIIGGFFGIAVVLILLAALWWLFSWGVNKIINPDTEAPAATPEVQAPKAHTDTEAYVDAEAIVKKTLKSPSTAKFPSSSYATVEHYSTDGFKVSSYVDSQNGFGAMIRSDWTVLFQYTPDEKLDIWQVIVDGQEIYRKPGQ
jgi:hypothetical protein